MNIIHLNNWLEIPRDFTGINIWADGSKTWIKNGKRHREDSPAYIENSGYKEWWLDGFWVWNSNIAKLDLTNKFILSKSPHPNYPTIQVWKILDSVGIYEQIVIPGMEEFIKE